MSKWLLCGEVGQNTPELGGKRGETKTALLSATPGAKIWQHLARRVLRNMVLGNRENRRKQKRQSGPKTRKKRKNRNSGLPVSDVTGRYKDRGKFGKEKKKKKKPRTQGAMKERNIARSVFRAGAFGRLRHVRKPPALIRGKSKTDRHFRRKRVK